MGDFPCKADGRRIFSAEFKRSTAQRILSGEKTLAQVNRELDIYRRYEDALVLPQVQAVIGRRASYGYRRVWAPCEPRLPHALQSQAHPAPDAAAWRDAAAARAPSARTRPAP